MINYINKFHLYNKTVFVIGGLGLLGSKITVAMFSANAKVVILDVDKKKSINFITKYNKFKDQIFYENFDCSKVNKIDQNLKKIINKYGVPEILINCSYPRTSDWKKNSFKKINLSSLRKNIDIHLNSFTWISKFIAEKMKDKNIRGSIINFGSIYGIKGQDLNLYKGTKMEENLTYSVIKGGITNLTRQLSAYYGKYNIRVNTLCPGGIKTSNLEKNFIRNYEKKVPLKRLGKSEEIASATLFLASDASSYITGITLVVDGGITIV